ncbi:hypothetical protein [Thermococcus prieurii]
MGVFMQAWYRSRALYDAVMKLVKAGKFNEAMKLAKGIPDGSVRSKAVNGIVVEMAKAGEDYRDALDRAIETALSTKNPTKNLMGLAFEFLEMGKFDDALYIAEHITDLANRSKVQAEVALRLARKGELDRAMKLIEDILDEDVKTWATSMLASEL